MMPGILHIIYPFFINVKRVVTIFKLVRVYAFKEASVHFVEN